MNSRTFVVAVALGFVSVLSVSAQIDAVPINGRGPTLAERLQQHNVALTTSALVAALRSSDTEVRELAALKLAEDGAKETIPSIEEALTAENVTRARVNIAFALAQLGNQRGVNSLADTCHNSALKPGPRLLAVQYMLDLSSNACLTAVLDVLQSRDEDDASYRMEALSLLPSFKHISKDQSNMFLESVVRNLADPTPAVRMSASDALASLGDPAAIPYLRSAIAAEPEEANRAFLETALNKLQQKK